MRKKRPHGRLACATRGTSGWMHRGRILGRGRRIQIMKLYRTTSGYVVEEQDRFYLPEKDNGRGEPWGLLTTNEDLHEHLQRQIQDGNWIEGARPAFQDLQAPIGNQEVWAAGVTYYRSREARIQESKSAGGGDFYDRVYDAERPELFFKATPHRVVGPNGKVAIRDDSSWSVPEPELALLVSPKGEDHRLHHWQRHEFAQY